MGAVSANYAIWRRAAAGGILGIDGERGFVAPLDEVFIHWTSRGAYRRRAKTYAGGVPATEDTDIAGQFPSQNANSAHSAAQPETRRLIHLLQYANQVMDNDDYPS